MHICCKNVLFIIEEIMQVNAEHLPIWKRFFLEINDLNIKKCREISTLQLLIVVGFQSTGNLNIPTRRLLILSITASVFFPSECFFFYPLLHKFCFLSIFEISQDGPFSSTDTSTWVTWHLFFPSSLLISKSKFWLNIIFGPRFEAKNYICILVF